MNEGRESTYVCACDGVKGYHLRMQSRRCIKRSGQN